MQPELIAWLIPLPPILAFFIIVLGANRSNKLSHSLALGGVGISWLLSMLLFARAISTEHLGEHPFTSSVSWLPTGDTALRFGIYVDPLTAAALFFVAWTLLAIFVYSVGYHNFGHKRDPNDVQGLPPEDGGIEPLYARFFAFISLFAFGMLTLVLSDNLLLLFIGWELMGLCSYLLIGFWYAEPDARDAAVKAFMTTRVGDVFMLLGIAYLYSQTGTLNYQQIFFNHDVMNALTSTPSMIGGLSVAGLIGMLLFIGTVGKSAQWPLHVWLPDAMEGPTPVSALIHAATMVSAGIFLILRTFPLLTAGWHEGGALTPTMMTIATIGSFTALFAATIAVAQRDIKRVLAYSTISQLGYMVAAVGIGAFVAAAFHLITHAFFKALLFLGSGSVIHGMEHGVHETHAGEHEGGHEMHYTDDPLDPQDMFNMGGLRHKMPVTFWTFLIGGFALSGFPVLTAGFWSKDEILSDAFAHGHSTVFWVLALAALLTAFYTMRQITLTFLGEPRSDAANHAHESTWTMTLPLVVLAIFALGAGWVGIPEAFPGIGGILPNWLHEFIGGALPEHPAAIAFNAFPLMVSLVVALGGLFLGWLLYRRHTVEAADPLRRPLGAVYTVLENKYYFDELYAFLFVRPAYWFAEAFTYRFLDRTVIDGVLHFIGRNSTKVGGFLRSRFDLPVINGFGDFVGEGTKSTGREFRFIQSGRVQQYLIVGMIFTGLLISYFILIGL
ncbi:MAG: NADH-quinone oxidoreductase subunit L [Anaerolineales bacterium]